MSVQGHSGSDVTFYQDLRPDANFWRTPGPSSTRTRSPLRRGSAYLQSRPSSSHGYLNWWNLLGTFTGYHYWGRAPILVGVGQVQALDHALTHRLKQLKALLDDRGLHLTALELAA